jgi:hypothetical protein
MSIFSAGNVAIGVSAAALIELAVEWDIRRSRRAHRAWVRSHSVVIGIIDHVSEVEGADGETTYVPHVVYSVPGGQRYSIQGESSGFPTAVMGSEVLVAYDADLPSDARLAEPPSWQREFSLADVVVFALLAILATAVSGWIRG